MAFQFPDPQTTSEFTADNGITYAWDVDDSKWQIKGFAAEQNENYPFTSSYKLVHPDKYTAAEGTCTAITTAYVDDPELNFNSPFITKWRFSHKDLSGNPFTNMSEDVKYFDYKQYPRNANTLGDVQYATFETTARAGYQDWEGNTAFRRTLNLTENAVIYIRHPSQASEASNYVNKEYVDEADQHLQIQIDELEQEIDVIAPRLDGAQYKYVGAPSVKPGEMHIASNSFTNSADLVFFNDQALDGTTHAWGSLHEGDYLEITDTQEKTKTAENYAMYMVTKEPEGTGMKQIEVALVKGAGAPIVDDILDAKGFQLGGNEINDLDARYIKLGGPSELTSSVVVKTPKGKTYNFGLHVQEGETAFYIKDKQGDPIFKVAADGKVIAGVDEENPFIATKPNHLTTKAYVDSQVQAYSGSPVTLTSGWDKKYSFKPLGSLNEREMSGTSLLSTGVLSTSIYLYRAYKQSGDHMPVLNYDRTEDSMIEVWEWNSGDNIPILRAGIKEIKVSSESQYDAELVLSKFWAKPGYNWSNARYYTFILHGLVQRPYRFATPIPANKLSNDE